MSTAPTITPLWQLVRRQAYIDAEELASAIDGQITGGDLDYRTRLLIRRGVEALERNWDPIRFRRWSQEMSQHPRFTDILNEDFQEVGFHHLADGVAMATKPEAVESFLAGVDDLLNKRLRIVVGGSVSVMLHGLLVRHTNDIDVVDEVPVDIRKHHAELQKLAQRWGIELGHFQSHYLPKRWEQRISWWKDFRHLSVCLIDPYDFYVGKLFSRREKDLDDLRSLLGQLEKARVVERLQDAGGLMAIAVEREKAEKNWTVLYGEALPASS